MIRNCKNVELRRVMVTRYGGTRFVEALGLKPVHVDDWGALYRAPIPNDEDLTMVKVVNNTPEVCAACGSTHKVFDKKNHLCKCGAPLVFKDYWLPVPPSITTAKDAVAWTWGEEGKEFHPVQRT